MAVLFPPTTSITDLETKLYQKTFKMQKLS